MSYSMVIHDRNELNIINKQTSNPVELCVELNMIGDEVSNKRVDSSSPL